MNNDLSSSGSSITSIVCLTENLFIFILCLSLCFALFHLDFIHLQMFSHQTQNLIFSQSDPFVCSKTRTCSASSAHRLKFKWSIRRIEGGPHTHTHMHLHTWMHTHARTNPLTSFFASIIPCSRATGTLTQAKRGPFRAHRRALRSGDTHAHAHMHALWPH